MSRKRRKQPEGLSAFEGKVLVSWEEISAATGLAVSTLKQYKKDKKMPPPDGSYPNIWRAKRKAVITWVQKQISDAGETK